MVTEAFLNSYSKYTKINPVLKSYEEKQSYWDKMQADFGDGLGVRPYSPSCPEFEEAHKSPAQYITLACGNRIGKTVWVSAEVTPSIADPKGNCRGWVLGNEYSIARNEWNWIERFIFQTKLYDYILEEIDKQQKKRDKTGEAKKYIKNTQTPTPKIVINWPDAPRTLIELKSYKDQSKWGPLEGVYLSWLILSEGSKLPRDLYYEHLFKRTIDQGAKIYNPSTPKGIDEMMCDMFEKGRSNKLYINIDYEMKEVEYHYEPIVKHEHHVDNATMYLESYQSWQLPAFIGKHYNKEAYEVDKMKLFNGELEESIFKQNIFGDFTTKSGRFFNTLPNYLFCKKEQYKTSHNSTYFRSCDIGSASPSCCLWFDVRPPDENGVEKWYIFRELYHVYGFIGDFAEAIKKENKERIEYTIVDRRSAHYNSANSPRTIEELLYDAGIPIITNDYMPNDTLACMTKLKSMMMSGRIVIVEDACPNLIKEIEIATYSDRKYIKGKATQEDKLAATPMHALDALVYFLYSNPYWIKPQQEKDEELNKLMPAKGSFTMALKRDKMKHKLEFSGIGSY